jgi:hypothetical protein
MQKIAIALILLIDLSACKEKSAQPASTTSTKKDSSIVIQDSSGSTNPGWADSLITGYINQSDNQFIKMARKDRMSIESMFDRTEVTDTAKYFVFQIGHSFEYKYITDMWLYIDSVTRNIYEYDVAKDSLIRWTK